MNSKFPVLSFISSAFKFFGWIIAVGGFGYAIVAGVYEPNQAGHSFNPSSDGLDIAFGSIGLIIGLVSIAIGEIIGVLFAIEENTRNHHM